MGWFLGFDVDAGNDIIEAPAPNVEGSSVFTLIGDFVVGSQNFRLKSLQTLGRYMQHWMVATLFGRVVYIQ